ncbi:hypothetical protein Tco_1150171, partial [Tanacetum coccineum]
LPPPSVSITPSIPQQTTTPIPTPKITTEAPIITTAVSESDALFVVQLRVAKLELVSYLEIFFIANSSEILKIKKEQTEKQKMLKFTIKSTNKAALKELYHALMESLIKDENSMDKGVADTHHNRKWLKTLKAFTISPYKEYLSEFWYSAKALDNSKVSFSIPAGGIYRVLGLNTFRKAIGAHYLSHSSDYMDPPSIDIALRPNHTKGRPFTAHMLAICNVEKPVDFKAPRTSSQTKKKVSQGTKPGGKVGHKK